MSKKDRHVPQPGISKEGDHGRGKSWKVSDGEPVTADQTGLETAQDLWLFNGIATEVNDGTRIKMVKERFA